MRAFLWSLFGHLSSASSLKHLRAVTSAFRSSSEERGRGPSRFTLLPLHSDLSLGFSTHQQQCPTLSKQPTLSYSTSHFLHPTRGPEQTGNNPRISISMIATQFALLALAAPIALASPHPAPAAGHNGVARLPTKPAAHIRVPLKKRGGQRGARTLTKDGIADLTELNSLLKGAKT